MLFTIDNILLVGSLLLFLSIIASKTTSRVGIPTLVIFLVAGMLAGSEGLGGIQFEDPKLTQFIGIIALNFILFSGGMDTRLDDVKPVLGEGLLLSTLGVFITAASVGSFVHWYADFTWPEALLLGAIVSSTDAAAVFSILRSKSVGLKGRLRPLLELESGSNDPMAYFLTITLTAIVGGQEFTGWELLMHFAQEMMLGAAIGFMLGYLVVKLVNKIQLEVDGLYPVLMLAFMIFTYSVTHELHGNGFLAVYLSAVIIGNSNMIHKKSLVRFYDGQAWLMQIIMFLTLGLMVFPSKIVPIIPEGIIISLFLIFIARPLGVFLSLAFSPLKFKQKLFLSWVGLRGAVPIIFATFPLIAGVGKSEIIFYLVFFISVTSVVLQGTTMVSMAKWLKLTVSEKLLQRRAVDFELNETTRKELAEYTVDADAFIAGKTIVDIQFPKNVLIVLINRNDTYITPNGSTVLEGGDKLMVLAQENNVMKSLTDLLNQKSNRDYLTKE
jgi:cell volume regulation protein A